jgi:CubicO group peptidase (beta-lactamase class C family)
MRAALVSGAVLFVAGVAAAAGCLPSARPARGADPRVMPLSPRDVLIKRLREIRSGSEGVEVAGIAVAYVAADGAPWSAAVGCARFEADGRTCSRDLTPETIVRVASISKLITAVGVMRLVETGRVDLDRDVVEYLGVVGAPLRNPGFPDRPITLRQLLSHTASLRDGAQYSIAHPGTLAMMLNAPDRFDLEHPPGTYFHYDNINYVVIGAVVERIAMERFDTFMSREVLRSAGVAAGYGWDALAEVERQRFGTLVRKRTIQGEVWDSSGPWIAQVDDAPSLSLLPPSYEPGLNPSLFSPHGGLRISAADLAALVRAVLRDNGQRGTAGFRPALLATTMLRAQFRESDGDQAGDSEGGFYRDFGLGSHTVLIGGRMLHAHFADAYGLKGGVFFDDKSGEVWVYLVTGYGGPPPARTASDGAQLPGLDGVEAAIVAAWFR